MKFILLAMTGLLISCASKEEEPDRAREYQNKVEETESRFDKLYKDLDRETK